MFKLNKFIKTKSGETVKPFLTEGSSVYCFTKKGKTVVKNLSDFSFINEEKKIATVEVSPVKKQIIFTPKITQEDQLFEQETKPVEKPKVSIIPENDGYI